MSKHEDVQSVVVIQDDAVDGGHGTAVAVDEAAPVEAAPEVAPAADAPAVAPEAPVEAHEVAPDAPEHAARGGMYPSLYDTKATTIVAVILGFGFIVGVQYLIERIFREAKDIHHALTRFVVSMVALLVAAYLCDLIISGPDTSLLSSSEKASILDFVKATALMIFSYFFGVKSAGSPPQTDKSED
jgi:hypothetical protein